LSNIELTVLLKQDAVKTNNKEALNLIRFLMTDSLGEVFILKTNDRATGVPKLLSKFDLKDYSGKQVALKANFNSADPFPASTHLDTLRAIVETLKDAGASELTLAERSGMGDTKQVL
jgi:uncharacterized protein (DUF362 family)